MVEQRRTPYVVKITTCFDQASVIRYVRNYDLKCRKIETCATRFPALVLPGRAVAQMVADLAAEQVDAEHQDDGISLITVDQVQDPSSFPRWKTVQIKPTDRGKLRKAVQDIRCRRRRARLRRLLAWFLGIHEWR